MEEVFFPQQNTFKGEICSTFSIEIVFLVKLAKLLVENNYVGLSVAFE